MKKILILTVLLAIMSPQISFAHPGRTDSSGCHTCRTNCANWGLSSGEYHCHNAKATPQPIAPIKSTYGEDGAGYTSPAPEYAKPKNVLEVQPSAVSTTSIKSIVDVATNTPNEVHQPSLIQPKLVEKRSWFYRLFGWIFS